MSEARTVRPATPGDAAAIAAGNVRLAGESEGKILDPAVVESGVAAILADPSRARYWVVEADGAIVGQCMVNEEPSDWAGGRYWWIQSVYVDPAWRGRGVFRALWDRVLEEARATGDVAEVRLYVERENRAARTVYERLGMEETSYRLYALPLGSGAGSEDR